MQIIGFNFTKMHGEKSPDFKSCGMNTHVEFIDMEKDTVPFDEKLTALKASFKYILEYGDDLQEKKKAKILGEISFEGNIILSVTEEESKQLIKSWKKQKLSPDSLLPLYNFILKKCSLRSVVLQEDLNLPTHLNIPQLKKQPKTE